ncbi:F0F1 ATP synthase subunit B [Pseudocolwellia sp. HL-MZ7]|uniref:F0F1 ATP synthase subunit B family protein n=1 Tax=Pseudocolwellia sp. HL-MZ7 TaxID=3400627 RepID=UPI003CEDBE50
MLIDWFTVAAQAINFLILIWLLKRYLYQPILHAIDDREQRIANELEDAAYKQDQAKTERDTFKDKNTKFDQERDKLFQQAKDEADKEREHLLSESKLEAETLRQKHREIMVKDAEDLKMMLSRKTSDEVFAITRKVLNDLATTNLEQQVTQVFIKQLSELESSTKSTLGKGIKNTSEPVVLSSAFDLSNTDRTAINDAINSTFDVDINLKFIISTDSISGIELSANGQKIGWNINDYLLSLEQNVVQLLKGKSVQLNKNKTKNRTDVTVDNDDLTENKQAKNPVEDSHE